MDRDLAMISGERITIVTALGTIGATAAVTASVTSVSRRATVTVIVCVPALTAGVGFETMPMPVPILVATVSTWAIAIVRQIARRPQIVRRFHSNPGMPERVPIRSDAGRERQRI